VANSLQHAKNSLEATHAHVQPYMAELFSRLASNYLLLMGGVLIVNMIGIPLLLRVIIIPVSTANILGFAAMLLILVYGWRFLENRNRATALFVLYIRYSRQRRELIASIEQAETDSLEDENTLYVNVDLYEESASSFLDAVEEQGLKAHPNES